VKNWTDQQLLRDYAGHRTETAFAELVRRHVDLVHSAARRIVGDAHLAEDVTQGVFVAFARSAGSIAPPKTSPRKPSAPRCGGGRANRRPPS
jgi:DNA-directed RNA polymerase specialized sigma24 family protein